MVQKHCVCFWNVFLTNFVIRIWFLEMHDQPYKYVWLQTWLCLIYMNIFYTCFQILISNGFHLNLFLVLQMQFTEKGRHYKIAGVLLIALCVLFADYSKIK